jgi:WD40 repeat protein
MPKPIEKLRSGLNRLREILFKGLFRARFRYDVFISYNHRAKGYAVNLKKQLADLDFSCFIDQEEAPPGSSLDPTLEKALSKSAVLVLLATERALTRPYIALEFQKFVSTGRRIIPINISGALTENNEDALARTPWNIIKTRKLIWIDEDKSAFAKEMPSPPIADGIDKLFKYTRRNSRVRTEIIGTAVLVLLLAVGAGFVIKGKAAEVSRQAGLADVAKKDAEKQLGIATEAGKEAQEQLGLAEVATSEAKRQGQIAETAKKEAEHQQEIARTATAEANKQQRIAEDAKLEADRQLERNRHMTYAENVSLAPQAYDNGLVNRASELLDDVSPTAGPAKKEDLRGFEWYYLAGLYDRKLADFKAHPGPVTSTAFSPDGKLLATGSRGTFRLWNATSRQLLKTLGDENEVVASSESNRNGAAYMSAVAFSPTAPVLATCSWNGTCSLWDTNSRTLLKTLRTGDSAQRVSVGFSPDGRMVAIGDSTVYEVWNTTSYSSIKFDNVSQQSADMYGIALAFSSDSQTLAISTGFGIELHDITSKDWRETLPRKFSRTRIMTFSPDGRSLLIGGEDGVVVYSMQDHKVINVWEPKERSAPAFMKSGNVVCFSPDGKEFATGEVDKAADGGEVKLWDATTNPIRLVASFKGVGNYGEVSSLAFSADNRVLSVGGRERVQLNDAVPERNSNIIKTSTTSTSVAFFPDSRHFATMEIVENSFDAQPVRIWDAMSRPPQQTATDLPKTSSCMAVSPDGHTMAICGKGKMTFIDVASQRSKVVDLPWTARGSNEPFSVAFSPDRQTLAVSGLGRGVVHWMKIEGDHFVDEPSNQPDKKIEVAVTGGLTFSPNGKLLVGYGHDFYQNQVSVWDAASHQRLVTIDYAGTLPRALAFSPNSKVLALGNGGGSVDVWDIASLLRSVAGKETALDSRVPKLRKDFLLTTLRGHSKAVNSIAFSADDKTLATGSEDETVKLWATRTYQRLLTLDGKIGSVNWVAFSPAEQTLLAGGEKGLASWYAPGATMRLKHR